MARKPTAMRDGDVDLIFIAVPLLVEGVAVVLFVAMIAVWAAIWSGIA
jgi:hypothetical protein